MITPTCFVGCDVGKKEIVDFYSDSGTSLTLPNQPEAAARFVDTLGPACLIICEATGGYEFFTNLLPARRNYGGLSNDVGMVQLSAVREGASISLCWQEYGGPSITTPDREGFESSLIKLSIINKMGGHIERDWKASGLSVRLHSAYSCVAPARSLTASHRETRLIRNCDKSGLHNMGN